MTNKQQKKDTASKEYENIQDSAYKEYLKITNIAWKEYNKDYVNCCINDIK